MALGGQLPQVFLPLPDRGVAPEVRIDHPLSVGDRHSHRMGDSARAAAVRDPVRDRFSLLAVLLIAEEQLGHLVVDVSVQLEQLGVTTVAGQPGHASRVDPG